MNWSLVKQNFSTKNPVILRVELNYYAFLKLGSEVYVLTKKYTLIILTCIMKNQ